MIEQATVNSPQHHFNSEAFAEGRGLITEGVASIKASIASKNYQAARETLGRVLHTLQVWRHTHTYIHTHTHTYIHT